jgi:hypothetical protein
MCTISCGQQLFLPDQGSENNSFLKKDTFLRTFKQEETENWENLFSIQNSVITLFNKIVYCICRRLPEVSGYI